MQIEQCLLLVPIKLELHAEKRFSGPQNKAREESTGFPYPAAHGHKGLRAVVTFTNGYFSCILYWAAQPERVPVNVPGLVIGRDVGIEHRHRGSAVEGQFSASY